MARAVQRTLRQRSTSRPGGRASVAVQRPLPTACEPLGSGDAHLHAVVISAVGETCWPSDAQSTVASGVAFGLLPDEPRVGFGDTESPATSDSRQSLSTVLHVHTVLAFRKSSSCRRATDPFDQISGPCLGSLGPINRSRGWHEPASGHDDRVRAVLSTWHANGRCGGKGDRPR